MSTSKGRRLQHIIAEIEIIKIGLNDDLARKAADLARRAADMMRRSTMVTKKPSPGKTSKRPAHKQLCLWGRSLDTHHRNSVDCFHNSGGKQMAKGPGKAHREALSIMDLFKMFPNAEAAERWFTETRWPDGVTCAHCGSDKIKERASRKPQPYWCSGCRKYFSVKTGTAMQDSKLSLQTWAVAIYMLATNLKGISSMHLHRDLNVTQKSAWHLAHRIRETWSDVTKMPGDGGVELDESYLGGKEKNKHADKKLGVKGGTRGKTVVAGAKDRATNKISAEVVPGVSRPVLHGFAYDRIAQGTEVFTDDLKSYEGLHNHRSVRHSVGEYVDGQAHINGMESFWAMLKRGYYGTYHRLSPFHLQKYVNEFAGRHNQRPMNTIDQMRLMAAGLVGKLLTYKDLIGKV